MFRYYRGAFIFTAICLALGGWLGWGLTGTAAGTLGVLWIVLVLGVLEVSLSFDNAIVNATVLRGMAPVWRRRFLLWGILIAVFGMRLIFPLAIVAIAAHVGPIEAVRLAATDPATYERIIKGAHVGIAGFGGSFLAMVGLTFFLDDEKETDWVGWFERPLRTLGSVSGLAIAAVLLALYGISRLLPEGEAMTYLVSGIFGLVAYVAVDALGDVIGGGDADDDEEGIAAATGAAVANAAKAGLGAFLYLEMLDASFSFDGVIGAFALSNNLFIIALGLGIGAMFVRSMTVMLVERGTLAEYAYLEHGAFYAILALAGIMLVSARYEVSDAVTGLIGAALIGLAFWSSVRHKNALVDPVGPTGERLSVH